MNADNNQFDFNIVLIKSQSNQILLCKELKINGVAI